MATRWKFVALAFGFGALTRRRAPGYAGATTALQYRCGTKAANDLDAFIARRPVSCTPISLDQYGRTVASCSVAGADVAEWLVRSGLALDWSQYSKGKYAAAQRDAECAGRGIWAGSYVEPWLYRACMRANGRQADCSDDANAHP
jgi:endonuclease YncB( thermonuclease family)